jgi:ribose transport system permease protein
MRRALSLLKNNTVIIAFLLLVIYSSFASKAFLTAGNIKTVLLQNSIYAICAIGELMIIIAGGIDLSVGSFVCLSVCLSAGFIQGGMGPMAIVYVALIAAMFGAISGTLVACAKVAPFVATLAMTSILKAWPTCIRSARTAASTALSGLSSSRATPSACLTPSTSWR